MKLIKPSVRWEHGVEYADALRIVECAARTCYQSFHKAAESTAVTLIRQCIKRGHESVLEHVSFGLRLITDRGVTHELVRHRIGVAFSQESTRYVRYQDIEFIEPWWWDDRGKINERAAINVALMQAEESYQAMLNCGASPQAARAVLPNCVKTEIVVTANMREWRHIFRLRRSPAAHPDMRGLMDAAWEMAKTNYPVFFEGE